MAERQIVFRWIRQHIGAILAAITLSALTVTSLDAGTVTADAIVAGDASLGITAAAEETIALSAGTIGLDTSGTFTLEMGVPGHLSTLTCNNGGCSFASAQTDTSFGVTVGTGPDVSSLDVVDTGITAGATGAASNVYLSWEDAALSSVFRLDDDPDLTSTGAISVTGDSVTMSTAGGTGDINLLSDNDISIQWGGSTLTLTADSAAFDVPITAATVVGGTGYRVPVSLTPRTTNFTPSALAEEVAYTVSIPAGALTGYAAARIEFWGSAAANTNNKILRLRAVVGGGNCLAGTLLSSMNFTAAGGGQVYARFEVMRESADYQYATGYGVSANAAGVVSNSFVTSGSSTIDDAGAIDLCINISNGTNTNDLTLARARSFFL